MPAFYDNFDGPAGSKPDPAKWNLGVGLHGAELQCYTPNNVELDGSSNLVLTLKKEPTVDPVTGTTKQWSSGWVDTNHKWESQYGLFAMRAKMPAGRGIWPAFWAVGNDHDTTGGWPRCGEIDITEVLGQDINTSIGTIHGPRASDPSKEWAQNGSPGRVWTRQWGGNLTGYAVYECLWEPGRLRWALNGTQHLDVKETDAFLPADHTWVFDHPLATPGVGAHPFWMILNLAVGGGSASFPGPPDATTPTEARMVIDWVRFTPLPI